MYLIDSQAFWAVVSFSRFVNFSSSSSVDNVTDERRDDLIAGRSLPVSFKINNRKILSFIFTENKFDLARLKLVRVHARTKMFHSVAGSDRKRSEREKLKPVSTERQCFVKRSFPRAWGRNA